MLDVVFNLPRGRSPTLLFVGAHSDDIEIGCGGTVLELLDRYPGAEVHWVVLSATGARAKEAKKSARMLLRRAKRAHVVVKEFRESYFPSEYPAIKQYFEEIKKLVQPDAVFVHHRDDLHQDHRVIGELAWNTFRDHLILEYEIPKFDGGLGSPSVFVPLSMATMRRKVAVLMRVFGTQRSKRWFTSQTFEGLMRLRGIECNAGDGYAEAFYSRKVVFGTRGTSKR
jgi:LmbE family N-acetylglucosaminyl deacetylase